MNNVSKVVMGVVLLGSLAGVAWAYTARVTIDSIHGVDASGGHVSLSNLILPATVYIDGTVTFDHPLGVKGVSMTATVNDEVIYGPEKPFANLKKVSSAPYSIPWRIERPGFYSITIAAQEPGNLENVDAPSKGACPAAPAIAVEYLKGEDGVGEHSNIIQEIAQETGKKGSFWAKEKCEPTYQTRTINFVVEGLAEDEL